MVYGDNLNLQEPLSLIPSHKLNNEIEMNFDNITKEDAILLVDQSCKELLVNPNTQTYTFKIDND